MVLRTMSRIIKESGVKGDVEGAALLLFYTMQQEAYKKGLLGHKDPSFEEHCERIIRLLKENGLITEMQEFRTAFHKFFDERHMTHWEEEY